MPTVIEKKIIKKQKQNVRPLFHALFIDVINSIQREILKN